MGMYNEVFKECPECGGKMYLQIPQVVYGFGGFDIDDKSTFQDLTVHELEKLKEYLRGETFSCQDEDCYNTWNYGDSLGERTIKQRLIDEL